MKVLFCHGLESAPHGGKYQALCEWGFEVFAPDCRGMNLQERVDLVSSIISEYPYVVGSSYGGITAVLAAMKAQVELRGLVLCAPALERAEEPNTDPSKLLRVGPTVIIHGVHDDMIPMEVSERYASRTGANLVKVDDDHRLDKSMGCIRQALLELGMSMVP